MIAVILISQRASENFDLNQKNLRGAVGKNGRIVQILRQPFRLPFANHAAKDSFAIAKRFATQAAAARAQADRADGYCAFCNSGCSRSRR
jgi:hypothetical protein